MYRKLGNDNYRRIKLFVEHKINKTKPKPSLILIVHSRMLTVTLSLILPLCPVLPHILIFLLPCLLCQTVSWSQRILFHQGTCPNCPNFPKELQDQEDMDLAHKLMGLAWDLDCMNFKSRLPFLAVELWASHWYSLLLSVLICRMGILITDFPVASGEFNDMEQGRWLCPMGTPVQCETGVKRGVIRFDWKDWWLPREGGTGSGHPR